MKNEPIAIRAVIAAVLVLLVQFGVPLAAGQNEAILGVVDSLGPWMFLLPVGIMGSARSVVTPVAKDKPKTPGKSTLGALVLLVLLPGCAWRSENKPIVDASAVGAAQLACAVAHAKASEKTAQRISGQG